MLCEGLFCLSGKLACQNLGGYELHRRLVGKAFFKFRHFRRVHLVDAVFQIPSLNALQSAIVQLHGHQRVQAASVRGQDAIPAGPPEPESGIIIGMPVEDDRAVSKLRRPCDGMAHQGGTYPHPLVVRVDAQGAEIQDFYFSGTSFFCEMSLAHALRGHHLRQAVDDMPYDFSVHLCHEVQLRHETGQAP